MSASNGQVLARADGGVIALRIVGRVTAHGCPALRTFAEEQIAAGATQIRIELADCTYFDSTFLGTLLCLKQRLAAQGLNTLQLCSPSSACRQILKQMAVAQLFTVCDAPACDTNDSAVPWQQLCDQLDHQNVLQFKENVVQAHRELAAVPGPLAKQFQAIVDIASDELEAAKAATNGRSNP
jgi:anti-anti-sigma factor